MSTLLSSFKFESSSLHFPFLVNVLIDHVTFGPLDMLIRRKVVEIKFEDNGHRITVSLALDRLLFV